MPGKTVDQASKWSTPQNSSSVSELEAIPEASKPRGSTAHPRAQDNKESITPQKKNQDDPKLRRLISRPVLCYEEAPPGGAHLGEGLGAWFAALRL